MASSHWLLKEPIISLPETKIINAHSGWLPKHKGLDSIGWSIKDGDPLGLTTHYIDKGIDTGSILKFYEVKPEKNENLNTIWNKIVAQKPHAFLDTIKSIEENQIEPQNQNDDYPPHIPMTFEELLETNNYFKKITS
ncbi:MAG: hypothetical protein C0599_07535 [Salinivirgaceae bacterium]|nr:MAG: hypothetical protein C0599_07535 [Salinivirgaceae bacterium]